MTDAQRRAAAAKFAAAWKNRGYEKGESQVFWMTLLHDVFGVENPGEFIKFEDQVKLDHTSFIDGHIYATHVLIEQKSLGKSLRTPIKQADGSMLSPFQQAKRYSSELAYSERPRWIVTCNFGEFLVYDMERPNSEPEEILLKNLASESYRLQFLVDTLDDNIAKETELSNKAGVLVGKLYDAILSQYLNPEDDKTLKSLNMLCVRLVFCLYAEDAGIFGKHRMFHNYMKASGVKNARRALIDLFCVLDELPDERDPYMDAELAAFPYVNGGLFSHEDIEIPQFTEEIMDLLLSNASEGFDWSQISPTIFGAVFESTLNPETRRSGGMHYTSIENIHKVIDPLFLKDLKAELDAISVIKVINDKKRKLREFQAKLSRLRFLDPACGSGNFLTETYICLRRLENAALGFMYDKQVAMGLEGELNPIKVSIGQFYGIEINDFAVTVARTALWIAESQMLKQTEDIIEMDLDFLPLKSYANIVEGNALRLDWETVVPKGELSYIMGNPPFVGFSMMSAQQKADMKHVFKDVKNLDYVAAWYKKASDFIQNTNIECGLVATNSITQGETVARLWPLLNIHINFAHTTFQWASESKQNAHVHCVIIGFACFDRMKKVLYRNGQSQMVANINAYLYDSPDVLVTSRNKPLCDVPNMIYGNKPADGGNLIIEDHELAEFIKDDPKSKKYIHRLIGATEFLHNKKRWCLWLVGASPHELRQCPRVMDRVKKCKEVRENSIAAGIRKFAATPTLFAQITQPVGKDYIVIPEVSSEKRRYVPMGYMSHDVICTNLVKIIPDAGLYHFGILTSNVHMAWMRAVAGRLEMRYRYSKDIVYNNFIYPPPTKIAALSSTPPKPYSTPERYIPTAA